MSAGEDSSIAEQATGIAKSRARRNLVLDQRAASLLKRQAALLQDQQRHLKLQHARERLHLLRDILVSLFLLAVVAGLAAMAWSASRSTALVVQPLRAPPQLAAQGLDGAALANRLLDKLEGIQASTATARSASALTDNWGDDIKLEIPQTGVSIGELNRSLRSALGHETRITGDVAVTQEGLQLVVRTQGAGAAVFNGPPSALEDMLQKAAEAVYARSQPYLYSSYLRSHGREDEALVVARDLALHGPRSERPWAYAGVSDLLFRKGDMVGAVAAGRRAVALDKNLVLGYANWGNAEVARGHDEQTLAALSKALRLIEGGRAKQISESARVSWPLLFRGSLSNLTGAHRQAAETFARSAELPGFETLGASTYLFEAQELAMSHQVSRSRRLLVGSPDPTDASTLHLVADWGTVLLPRYEQAAALDDWPAAVLDLEAVDRTAGGMGRLGEAVKNGFIHPRLAHAYAVLGRRSEAKALVARLPEDCYVCLRARGKVAALTRDETAAEAWFQRATELAPSLPTAFDEWGQTRLWRGDAAGAAQMFAKARVRGPQWPEPLAHWGDALMRQGNASGAAAKYRQALKIEPAWGGLHLHYALALERQGRRAEAASQFRQALQADLSRTDLTAARAGFARVSINR